MEVGYSEEMEKVCDDCEHIERLHKSMGRYERKKCFKVGCECKGFKPMEDGFKFLKWIRRQQDRLEGLWK
jgi:hypothetical protein